MDYRQAGLETYGHKCEICGYSIVEVHHINYQEHQAIENKLRKTDNPESLLEKAREMNFTDWDGHQLSKDNRSTNLAVLCGNCHSLIHRLDVGMNLIKVLDRRK
jgi:hypothetical protein